MFWKVLYLFLSVSIGLIAEPHLQFEAASVKSTAPDARATAIFMPPGGRLEIVNMTLKSVIENAYNVQPFQISGGPGWMDTDRYDISAKAGVAVRREEILQMLQALLADRFRLKVRREVKQLPIYDLVMARKDRKPGPQLTETKRDCVEPDPANPFAVDSMRLCGNFALGPSELTLVSAPISKLIPLLSRILGRAVLDKTGLTRNFDIHIEWTPDESQAMQPIRTGQQQANSTRPAIFTVFKEQLGLEFKSQKGPVEIFVVERGEKPAAN